VKISKRKIQQINTQKPKEISYNYRGNIPAEILNSISFIKKVEPTSWSIRQLHRALPIYSSGS